MMDCEVAQVAATSGGGGGGASGRPSGDTSLLSRPFTRNHIHVGRLPSAARVLVPVALDNPALAPLLTSAGRRDAAAKMKLNVSDRHAATPPLTRHSVHRFVPQVDGLAAAATVTHVLVDEGPPVDVGNHLSATVAIPRACALLLYLLRHRGGGNVCGVNVSSALNAMLRTSSGSGATRRTGIYAMLDDN